MIQVGVAMLIGVDVHYWDYLFAAVAIAAVIPLLIFIFLQRYYLRGIATTGLKG
jgi:ABC-type glycerol-3-phosphate transport system permease component